MKCDTFYSEIGPFDKGENAAWEGGAPQLQPVQTYQSTNHRRDGGLDSLMLGRCTCDVT